MRWIEVMLITVTITSFGALLYELVRVSRV
jgi:hypothetical protein